MAQLTVRRITTATVYRLLFWGLLIGCVPIFTVFGIFGYFGMGTMAWNEQQLHGFTALIAGPFMGVFFALIGTAFCGTAAALGLWIRSKFKPISLDYHEEP